jgi:hypothetical protein
MNLVEAITNGTINKNNEEETLDAITSGFLNVEDKKMYSTAIEKGLTHYFPKITPMNY